MKQIYSNTLQFLREFFGPMVLLLWTLVTAPITALRYTETRKFIMRGVLSCVILGGLVGSVVFAGYLLQSFVLTHGVTILITVLIGLAYGAVGVVVYLGRPSQVWSWKYDTHGNAIYTLLNPNTRQPVLDASGKMVQISDDARYLAWKPERRPEVSN